MLKDLVLVLVIGIAGLLSISSSVHGQKDNLNINEILMNNMSADLLSESKGNIPETKIVGIDIDESPIIEITMSGQGKISGDIEFTEMWTYKTKQNPDGVQHGEGIGVFMIKDGGNETVTAKSQGVSTVTENGIKQYIGANFYSTSSTGKFAFMNNLVGMFKAEVDESGNYTTKVWEWK